MPLLDFIQLGEHMLEEADFLVKVLLAGGLYLSAGALMQLEQLKQCRASRY